MQKENLLAREYNSFFMTGLPLGGMQPVAFTHGDSALDQDFIGVMDNPVHNGI